MYEPLSQKNCGNILMPFTHSVLVFSVDTSAPPRKNTLYSELLGKFGAPQYEPLLFIRLLPWLSYKYSHYSSLLWIKYLESSQVRRTSCSMKSSSKAKRLKPSNVVLLWSLLSYSQKIGQRKLCSQK